MAVKNADRTHCVTFVDGGRKYWAVKSREYGDPVPVGISPPEVRCAMTHKDATKIAEFLRKESVNFTNVRVCNLSK